MLGKHLGWRASWVLSNQSSKTLETKMDSTLSESEQKKEKEKEKKNNTSMYVHIHAKDEPS